MRIEYDLKFRDYLLFNGLHQLLSPAVQLFYLLCGLSVFLTEPEDNSLAVRLLSAILLYIAVWIVQLLFNAITDICNLSPVNNTASMFANGVMVSSAHFLPTTCAYLWELVCRPIIGRRKPAACTSRIVTLAAIRFVLATNSVQLPPSEFGCGSATRYWRLLGKWVLAAVGGRIHEIIPRLRQRRADMLQAYLSLAARSSLGGLPIGFVSRWKLKSRP